MTIPAFDKQRLFSNMENEWCQEVVFHEKERENNDKFILKVRFLQTYDDNHDGFEKSEWQEGQRTLEEMIYDCPGVEKWEMDYCVYPKCVSFVLEVQTCFESEYSDHWDKDDKKWFLSTKNVDEWWVE